MGNEMKNVILVAQVLMISSVSFGQLKYIDYTQQESSLSSMRFHKVSIQKLIIQGKDFNLMPIPRRQLNPPSIKLTGIDFHTRTPALREKAKDIKILNYPRLYFPRVFTTREKVGLKKKRRVIHREAFTKNHHLLVDSTDSRKAKFRDLQGEISMQAINRFNFRQSHVIKPGLPVQSVGTSKINTRLQ